MDPGKGSIVQYWDRDCDVHGLAGGIMRRLGIPFGVSEIQG
jgi:hypothetical protein